MEEVRYTSEYVYELYHHGIKGQRWGVRRYQKQDGSLTPAGKKRYYDTPELNKQRRELESAKERYKESKSLYNKASNHYQNVPLPKNYDKLVKARDKFIVDQTAYRRTKLKYDTNKEVARIQDKGVEFTKKSKHRLKLEEQFKQMGMNDEQAQAAANNRIKTEKILAASAALTVAACATYVAVQSRKNKIDGIIKAGENLQRIEMVDTGGKLHESFFVAKGKHDTQRYKNLLGASRQASAGHAYLMDLQAVKDVKVASNDRAAKVFGELYKNDSDFRRDVEMHVRSHFGGSNKIRDIDNMSPRNIRKMYDNFNSGLPFIREGGSGADKKFYNKLKAAGYGAIQDINDKKYSGYSAKNPLIIFDNSRNSILVKSVREMTEDMNRKGTKELMKATGETMVKDFFKKAGPMSAAGLTVYTARTYRSDPNNIYNIQGGASKWS